MAGHWSHQPRTPVGVRTGGEWEIGLLPESGVSLAPPDATQSGTPDDSFRHPVRWPRIPRSFEQFTVPQRNLIMRCLPYYDTDEGLTPRNLDALRATIAEATAGRFSGTDENHQIISHAARLVAEHHGGVHQMAIDAGRHISARAEELAGATDEQAASTSAEAIARSQSNLEHARAAVDAYRSENFAKATDPILMDRLSDARNLYSSARSSRDKETMAAVTAISQARQQALSEVIDLGGELNLHDRSTKKAIAPFEQAATKFPASWLEHSNEKGPLLLRYSSSRNHYNPTTQVKSEKTAPVTRQMRVPAGAEANQGPEYEPVRMVESGTDYLGNPTETWEFTQYEVVRAGGYLGKLDRRYAEYDRKDNGHTASGAWKPVGDGERERRALRHVVSREAEYVPMANTGGDKAPAAINGPEGEHGVSTAAHELTHHMEKTVPSFYELERAFWNARTEGSEYHSYMGLKGEVYKEGGFANIYIGKDYNWRGSLSGQERRSTEIGSMGMEMLFHGKHGAFAGTAGNKADPQMRDFMLGTLVAVDPSREPIRTGIPVYAPSSHRSKDDSLFGRRGTTVVDQQSLPNGRVRIRLSDGRTGEASPDEVVVG